MKKEIIAKLHGEFEDYANIAPDTGLEFWLARDLQKLLGYAQWRRFAGVIEKAKMACDKAGQHVSDHFAGVGKMVDIGSGVHREIEDIALRKSYILQ